jgi:uncharacterized protein
MTRKILQRSAIVLISVGVLFCALLWFATNMLLFPSWRGVSKNLAVCPAEAARYWGQYCGNLRRSHSFAFSEIRVPSINGYQIPGWLIESAQIGAGPARGVIFLVHAGGSDRREGTRYVHFLLSEHLDVVTFDLGCHGEAPCPVPGLTYGDRESRDAFSVYRYLIQRYDTVFAMGTSVGAAAILTALPDMPHLAGAIAENPLISFQRLMTDTSASRSTPRWFINTLVGVTEFRGRFDGLVNPMTSLKLVNKTPIYFIHSKQDTIVPYQQTEELAAVYGGPKTVWISDKGDHTAIWDADPTEFEARLRTFLRPIP